MYKVELSQTLKATWTNSGRLKREWLQFYRHDRSVRRKFSALSGAVSHRTARGTGNSKRDKRDREQQEGQGTATGTGNSNRDRVGCGAGRGRLYSTPAGVHAVYTLMTKT